MTRSQLAVVYTRRANYWMLRVLNWQLRADISAEFGQRHREGVYRAKERDARREVAACYGRLARLNVEER